MAAMEVDTPIEVVSPILQTVSLETTVEELEQVIGELDAKPHDVKLLRRQLALVKQLEMQDEIEQAVTSLSQQVALDEADWIPYLESAVKALPSPLGLEELVTVLERFTAAAEDYISMPILMLNLQLILTLAVCANPQLVPQADEDAEPLPYPFPTAESPLLGLDQDVIDFLTVDTLSGLVQSVAERGKAVISQSHLLWNPWCRWELIVLESSEGEAKYVALQENKTNARKQKIANMHDVFLARLGTVHANHAETSQQYSTFTSKYSQNEYEERLVAATEVAKEPKRLLESEKRYGKTREVWEAAVETAASPSEQSTVYKDYLEWELLPAIRPPGTRAHPATAALHAELITALYERTLASFARAGALHQSLADEAATAYEAARVKAEASAAVVAKYGKPLKGRAAKGKKQASRIERETMLADEVARVEKEAVRVQLVAQARAQKEGEAKIWHQYAVRAAELEAFDEVATEEEAPEAIMTAATYNRATRACPQSALLWSRYTFAIERGLPGNARETYAKALGLGLLLDPLTPVDGFVELALTRAAFEARLGGDLLIKDEELEAVVTQGGLLDEFAGEGRVPVVILSAAKTISEVWAEGDPQSRLEKFAWQWAQTFNVGRSLEQQWLGADDLWDAAKKTNGNSYRMWLAYVDYLKSDPSKAAQVSVAFRDAAQRHTLDWPDAIWEQWLDYERVYGDAAVYGAALRIVDRERTRVGKKREETAAAEQARLMEEYEAQVQAMQAMQVGAAEAQVAEQASGIAAEAMDADAASVFAPALTVAPSSAATTAFATSSRQQDTKKHGSADHVKRDRENTTILVTGLAKGTSVDDVEKLFEDCGETREVTVLPRTGKDTDAAFVEFETKDSVPAALTKDKKRIGEHEVDVVLLWRATLYVTNFPPTADDEEMKILFSTYGSILQTRWPSRKYGESRRFLYLTFDSPVSAQKSLELHGKELAPGFSLSVKVSDPAAKQARTDVQPEGRTLFMKGLHRSDTQESVETLCAAAGPVTSISLGMDKNTGEFKGFAFVVMETEEAAQAILELSGTKRQGKKLHVELASKSISDKSKHQNQRSAPVKGASTTTTGLKESKDRAARSVKLYDLPSGTQEGLLQQALEKITEVKRVEIFEKRNEAHVELASQAVAGALLLRQSQDPFVFNGVPVRILPEGAKSEPVVSTSKSAKPEVTNPLSFAPRPARTGPKGRLGLGAGHSAPRVDKVLDKLVPTSSGGGQDMFRAAVAAKNEQRKGNLEAARAPAAKAPRFVHASKQAEAEGEHALPDTSIEIDTDAPAERGEKRSMDVDGEEHEGKKAKLA